MGWSKHINIAFLSFSPRTVVSNPILKLANKNIPIVITINVGSVLENIETDASPKSAVINQIKFPNNDMWRALEYSLFLIKRESINCVITRAVNTNPNRRKNSSLWR